MNIDKGFLASLKSLWGQILIVSLFAVLFATQSPGLLWLDTQLFRIAASLISIDAKNNDVVIVDLSKVDLNKSSAKEITFPHISSQDQLTRLISILSVKKMAALVYVTQQLPVSGKDDSDIKKLKKRLSDLSKNITGRKSKKIKKEIRGIKQSLQDEFGSYSGLAETMARNNVILALPVNGSTGPAINSKYGVEVKWLEDKKPLGVYISDVVSPGFLTVKSLNTDSNIFKPDYAVLPVYNDYKNISRSLLWAHEGLYYPDLVAYLYGKLEGGKILSWAETSGLKYFSQFLKTDIAGNIIPLYSAATGQSSDVKVYSPSDFFKGQSKNILSGLSGKVVLIGDNQDYHLTDIALVIKSMRNKAVYHVPAWAQLLAWLLPVVLFLYLFFFVSRIGRGTGLILGLFALFILLTAEIGVLVLKGVWLPLSAVIAFLFVGHFITLLKKSSDKKLLLLYEKIHESNWALAQNQFDKGDYTHAVESLKNCFVSEKILDKFYKIGLEFERQREYDKAKEIFSYIKSKQSNYKDIDKRILTLINVNGEQPAIISPFNGEKTMVMSDSNIEKPVIGRYELIRELGRGEMGIVYLGKDPKINREVAIKTMNFIQFSKNELNEVKQRFFREAETAGKLSHPNIVTIYDVGDERDLAFIAMDYVSGHDMSAYVQKEEMLPVETVLSCIIKVAVALDYAHKQGVVHRDIKPGNIIYDVETDLVKVTDFGIARIMDTANTRTGTILGSPAYMSPEQLAGKKVTGTADLFSLGVTLYQLLAGVFPFKGDNIAELAYKIANEKHQPVRDLRPELPKSMTRVINKALNKDPVKRYATGNDMKEALEKVLEDL